MILKSQKHLYIINYIFIVTMNKKLIYTLICMSLLFSLISTTSISVDISVDNEPIIYEKWIQKFGEFDNKNIGHSVQQTNDGGYIIAGSIRVYGERIKFDIYISLIKTDANGNEEWNRTFGETNSFYVGESVQQTNDSGYMIAGYMSNSNSVGYDCILIKTDANGDEEWNKTFDK